MPTDNQIEILNFLDNEAGEAFTHYFETMEECDDHFKNLSRLHKKAVKLPGHAGEWKTAFKNMKKLMEMEHEYGKIVRDLQISMRNFDDASRAHDEYIAKNKL